MSSDFRQIAYSNGVRPKADGLFRAAVSAFSSLTRPTRREVIQLEDLAEPLYPALSVEAKRFAAAALSESRYAPAELIRRLADEPVDVGAPLLIRSPVLTDVDLIAFIGRHGVPHARAIRRRPDLNPAIAKLAEMLEETTPKATAETTLEQLRLIMQARSGGNDTAPTAVPSPHAAPARSKAPDGAPPGEHVYARMLATMFEPNPALFQTALADALGIAFERAVQIVSAPHYSELMLALGALGLREERAFLLVAAAYPAAFGDRAAVLLFLQRYRQIVGEQPAARLHAWRKENAAASPGPAQASAAETRIRRVKAS